VRGTAGRVLWLAVAALVVPSAGAAAKQHEHGTPPGHAPGKQHGPPPGHVKHGNPHGHQAPPAAAPPVSPPPPPPTPSRPSHHRPGRARDGSARRRDSSSTGARPVHKAVHALLPLEELGASAPAAHSAPTHEAPHARARHVAVSRTTGNKGETRPRRGRADGPLPFTGLALLTLVLTGLALVMVGGRIHRSARAEPPTLAPPPRPERPEHDPMGGRNGRSPLVASLSPGWSASRCSL
jgi:hypothetical protein